RHAGSPGPRADPRIRTIAGTARRAYPILNPPALSRHKESHMRTRWLCAAAGVIGLALASIAAERGEQAGPTRNPPPRGFTALFNGKDLTNWQGAVDIGARAKLKPEELAKRQEEANKLMAETWTVEDGVLVQTPKVVEVKGKTGKSETRKTGLNLATAKDYGDFEFWVDWKIEKAGDSGIYLRGTPQVQIWDSDNLPAGLVKVDGGTGSGGLWNNPLPQGVDPKSIGKT